MDLKEKHLLVVIHLGFIIDFIAIGSVLEKKLSITLRNKNQKNIKQNVFGLTIDLFHIYNI